MSDYLASILNDLPNMSDNEDEDFLLFVDYINDEDFRHEDTSRNVVMKLRVSEEISNVIDETSDDNEVSVIEETSDDNEVIVIDETSDDNEVIVIDETSDDNEVIVIEETFDDNEVIVIEETSDEMEVISMEENPAFTMKETAKRRVIEETADDNELIVIEEDIDEPQITLRETTQRMEDSVDQEDIIINESPERSIPAVNNEMKPIDSHYVPMTEEDRQLIIRINANIGPANIQALFERQLENYNYIMMMQEQEQKVGVTTRSQRNALHHLTRSNSGKNMSKKSTLSRIRNHQHTGRSVYRNI
jgi:hypothetical protein